MLRLVLMVPGVGTLVVILLAMTSMMVVLSGFTAGQSTAAGDIPADVLPLYIHAGASRGIDWAYLAAIGKIETDHGRSNAAGVKSGVNFAGCCAGPMQFSIIGVGGGTWGAYGVDGNGDGRKSVYDLADAIPAAADYLKASGAPRDMDRAIFAYNHASWYVEAVKRQADLYRGALQTTGDVTEQRLPNSARWLETVPGTTARCDTRIVADVVALMRRYRMALGDCYAPTGHEASGEHPLGLAIDVTPARSGSWELLGQAARDLGWREGCGDTGCVGQLPPPMRFIGWNGYPGHGDPAHAGSNAHLHLSWGHGPGRPAEVVQTLSRKP